VIASHVSNHTTIGVPTTIIDKQINENKMNPTPEKHKEAIEIFYAKSRHTYICTCRK